MDQRFAQKFAEEWIEAWNSHDLEVILAHYTDNFRMNSPIIRQLTNEPSGTLKGKEAVRAYWLKALKAHPDLHFELLNTFTGIDSVVIHYRGHRGLSAEVFFFDEHGKVTKAYAHYET